MVQFPSSTERIPVEFKRDQHLSFMSKTSINLLKKFNKHHLFVPVTTRSLTQYKRIKLFQRELVPKLAIVNNGGTILLNGKVDENWKKAIENQINGTSAPKEDIFRLLSYIGNKQWIEKITNVDDLFFLLSVKSKNIPIDEIPHIETEFLRVGWRIHLNGRKLYILPICLSKATAIIQIKKYVDFDFQVAAGDSFMDLDMLKQATYGFSPKHGEIFKAKHQETKINWLNETGLDFAEELLHKLFMLSQSRVEKVRM